MIVSTIHGCLIKNVLFSTLFSNAKRQSLPYLIAIQVLFGSAFLNARRHLFVNFSMKLLKFASSNIAFYRTILLDYSFAALSNDTYGPKNH